LKKRVPNTVYTIWYTVFTVVYTVYHIVYTVFVEILYADVSIDTSNIIYWY